MPILTGAPRPLSKKPGDTSVWKPSGSGRILAILRTTPALLGLFSLVTLWATRLATERSILPDYVCWYPKHYATFSDALALALALVRSELWTSTAFGPSPSGREMQKIPADLLDRLMLIACRPP